MVLSAALMDKIQIPPLVILLLGLLQLFAYIVFFLYMVSQRPLHNGRILPLQRVRGNCASHQRVVKLELLRRQAAACLSYIIDDLCWIVRSFMSPTFLRLFN